MFFCEFCKISLREKCPNTELCLVRIFLYSDWIRRCIQSECRKIRTRNNSVFLDTVHAVYSELLFYRRLRKNLIARVLDYLFRFFSIVNTYTFNSLSANPTKWSDTLKQFVGCCQRIVEDHFVGLALKGLNVQNLQSPGK